MSGDYLWDRTGSPDPEIVRLERVLGTLRYQPAPATTKPIPGIGFPEAPTRSSSRAFMITFAATAAAVLVLVAVTWREASLPRPALVVTSVAGTAKIDERPIVDGALLGVGKYLETAADGRASVDVASVGRVEVSPDTRLGLVSTRPGDHRLNLKRGTMEAFIWAPPGQFSVKTPSSTAVDLGCLYSMTVDDDGTGIVRVKMGWVGFEWNGRESFIPKDAMCITRPRLGPGTPHYEDTSQAFRDALDVLDVRSGSAADQQAALTRVLSEARQRDALTLWHLLSRVAPTDRDRVYDRLALLVPPPPEVTREGVRAGTREMLDAWWDKLDLGTADWWRVWKQQWRDNAWRQ